jgi:SAM-dependent methyltransferase
MYTKLPYHWLETPWIYRLCNFILAPSSRYGITRKIKQLVRRLPTAHIILDIGCGPSSLLWRAGLNPIGIDLSFTYSLAFRQHGKRIANGEITRLPFQENSFDGVWNIRMLHHLPDHAVKKAVKEMIRICRPGGYIVIFDMILPRKTWHNPLVYLLRRADRGQFARTEKELEEILPSGYIFKKERVTYSLIAHQAVLFSTVVV